MIATGVHEGLERLAAVSRTTSVEANMAISLAEIGGSFSEIEILVDKASSQLGVGLF
ncbi:hypothetical protein HYV73_03040 [Candidatus Uhrbacteria bacterium]|nr:hypothetical protein [Candidatus Uhrbacteria bacterium]